MRPWEFCVFIKRGKLRWFKTCGWLKFVQTAEEVLGPARAKGRKSFDKVDLVDAFDNAPLIALDNNVAAEPLDELLASVSRGLGESVDRVLRILFRFFFSFSNPGD